MSWPPLEGYVYAWSVSMTRARRDDLRKHSSRVLDRKAEHERRLTDRDGAGRQFQGRPFVGADAQESRIHRRADARNAALDLFAVDDEISPSTVGGRFKQVSRRKEFALARNRDTRPMFHVLEIVAPFRAPKHDAERKDAWGSALPERRWHSGQLLPFSPLPQPKNDEGPAKANANG